MVIGEAVNRNTLIEIQERQYIEQHRAIMFTNHLIDFINLKRYSNATFSRILTLTPTHFSFFDIVQNPPEIQCVFDSQNFESTVSLLIQFNTTHCPDSPPSEKGGT